MLSSETKKNDTAYDGSLKPRYDGTIIEGVNSTTKPEPTLLRYRANITSCHYSGERFFTIGNENGAKATVDSDIAYHLTQFEDFAPIETHAQFILKNSKALKSDPSLIVQELKRLIHLDLLQSEETLRAILKRIEEPNPMPKKISTLAVITRDRPLALDRCLKSYIENAVRFGKRYTIIVSDDSKTKENRSANNEILKKIASKHPDFEIRYIGYEEKTRYIQRIVEKSGLPNESIRFLLLPDPGVHPFSAGANRNAILLDSIGEHILCVDDDSICETAYIQNLGKPLENNVRFKTHDPRSIENFPNQYQCEEYMLKTLVDFIAEHERFLGRRLSEISHLSTIQFDKMKTRNGKKVSLQNMNVRLSWSGFYGDSGISYPTLFLTFSNKNRTQLLKDEQHYRTSLLSREVSCGVDALTLVQGFYSPSAAMGFDNSTLLPFFTPVARGEDFGFGDMMQICFPDSLTSFNPVCIQHRPLDSRSNRPEELFKGVNSSRFINFMREVQQSAPDLPHGSTSSHRFKNLGNWLITLSELPRKEFEAYYFKNRQAKTALALSQAEQFYASHHDAPRYWRSDYLSYIQNLKFALSDHTAYIPEDMPGEDPSERLNNSRSVLHKIGTLQTLWTSIYECASELNRNGEKLSRLI